MHLKNKAIAVSATHELKALLQVDNTHRQRAWYSRFMMCLPHALFTSGEPEILFNEAGFTYYNLELNEINSEELTTSYNIPELFATFLISEGVGIVIEARNPKQSIDLSYGDILGFYLYDTFAEPKEHPFKAETPQIHMIREGTDVLIGEVPEHILPATTKKLLEEIMLHFGITIPEIKLVYLPHTSQYELAFSIDKNQYSPETIQAMIQKLGWFLPRYYSYVACDLNDVSSLIKIQ